jgi:hypothetical protein
LASRQRWVLRFILAACNSGEKSTIPSSDADFSSTDNIIIINYLVCEAFGTAATPGLLCQPRMIMKMIVEKEMECRWAGKTEVLGENLPQRHFCPSQNPTWPDTGLNPGSRRLTAWAMARPTNNIDCFIGSTIT